MTADPPEGQPDAVHRAAYRGVPHRPPRLPPAEMLRRAAALRVLGDLLDRPANEKAAIVFPVGYPAEGARVPDLERKPLEEVAVWNPRPGAAKAGAPRRPTARKRPDRD